MKDKDEVTQLLSKLTLKNNLDKEDDKPEEKETVVESVVVLDKDEDKERDEYTSKGPVRGNNLHQSRANPYQMPLNHAKNVPMEANVKVGRFIDDETEMEFIMSRLDLPESASNAGNKSPNEEDKEKTGIPELPRMEKRPVFKAVLLIQNQDADYQVHDLGLKIVLDQNLRRVGVWIPETILDEAVKADPGATEMEIYIQLTGPDKARLISSMVGFKKDPGSGKNMLTKQFVHFAPMNHAGTTDMTCDIDPAELQTAIQLVSAKNVTDLLKSYGPNDESLLMTLCCHKNDSPALRAQVFALLAVVLEEANQEAIEMIIKKNQVGLTALDYATVANNAKITAFLAKIFYIFGQDVLGRDSQGNTILHMMARKGDLVASTLATLLTVTYRDHNDNRRVYNTDIKNARHEMPIHIAAMNKKCAQHIIQLLVKDCPDSLKSPTEDGSLPIHLACQYSSDPTLLATLLYYDKSVINTERADTFSPLHLVAARADVHDVRLGLIRLDEETQVRMIKILLEHGANKMAMVEDMYHPVDLLSNDRSRAKDYLKLTRGEKKQCSSSGSSDNGSPTPPSTLNTLNEQTCMMTPSPEVASLYNDPYMNMGSNCYSPAASTTSYQTGTSSPAMYNIGSVTSNCTGSDPDSDSDNCASKKLGPENLEENEDLDFIAKVLYNHPTIQAVMANNLDQEQ